MYHFHGVRRPDLQQVHQQSLNPGPVNLFHGQIMERPEKIPDDTLIPLPCTRLPALLIEAIPFLDEVIEGPLRYLPLQGQSHLVCQEFGSLNGPSQIIFGFPKRFFLPFRSTLEDHRPSYHIHLE